MKRILLVTTLILLFAAVILAQAITDDEGRIVEFNKPFERIITLYGAHTENLFHLGAGDQLVGVSTSEAFPPQVHALPAYSYKDDAEKFIAANPDLILIRPFITRKYGGLVEKLENMGITVVSMQPESVEEMASYIERLGMLTGKEEAATQMMEDFNTEIELIKEKVATIPESERKTVFFETIHKSFKTPTPDSIAWFVVNTAGGENIAYDARATSSGSTVADFSKEKLLERGTDLDKYIAQKGAMNKVTMDQILNEPGYGALKAINEREVYIVDEMIMSRPTWRILTGIEELARIIYPETFNKVKAQTVPLTNLRYAEMMVKKNAVQYFTPGYDVEQVTDGNMTHTYGDFSDLDYEQIEAITVETAVFAKMLPVTNSKLFNPEEQITYEKVKGYMSRYFTITDQFNGLDMNAVPTEIEFLNLLAEFIPVHTEDAE